MDALDQNSIGMHSTAAAYDGARARLWVRRYTGPVSGGPNDVAFDLAVDPLGARVFVTGVSDGYPTFGDYATVAYSAT